MCRNFLIIFFRPLLKARLRSWLSHNWRTSIMTHSHFSQNWTPKKHSSQCTNAKRRALFFWLWKRKPWFWGSKAALSDRPSATGSGLVSHAPVHVTRNFVRMYWGQARRSKCSTEVDLYRLVAVPFHLGMTLFSLSGVSVFRVISVLFGLVGKLFCENLPHKFGGVLQATWVGRQTTF